MTRDLIVVKLTRDRTLMWAKKWGDAEVNDFGYALDVATDGSVVVAGLTESDSGTSSALVMKLNSTADFVWGIAVSGEEDFSANTVKVAEDGDVVWAGQGYQPFTATLGAIVSKLEMTDSLPEICPGDVQKITTPLDDVAYAFTVFDAALREWYPLLISRTNVSR